MRASPLSAREAIAWAAAFLVVAILIVLTRFTSEDPDSALYAALSARLAAGPASHWIAPEWWGHWESEGWFREHPAGVFLIPTALGAAGVPGEQAAYVVGVAAGLASLVLIGTLVTRITSPAAGRMTLVLLQLMPAAFIFRIRANHEYPMLLCLLLTLVGLDRVRGSWRWMALVVVSLTAAMLIKAVFVVLILMAAILWIVTNPTRAAGPAVRPLLAVLASLIVMAGAALAYDELYSRATGEAFWLPYWERQMGPLTIATPLENASMLAGHAFFYVNRMLWHAAPWSLALIASAWVFRGQWRATWDALGERERRGLTFALGFAVGAVALLSPSSRFAERYAFSATYAVAAAGVIVAIRVWPRVRNALMSIDARVPALPVTLWFLLMAFRLALGPWLPRLSLS